MLGRNCPQRTVEVPILAGTNHVFAILSLYGAVLEAWEKLVQPLRTVGVTAHSRSSVRASCNPADTPATATAIRACYA